ncbi:MAG: tyrosine-type recombinase/integrase, partial [Lachnospiraceae bacterium]|nr:tyrosine-type recombinase/integrase [Lachnospiraceae bacterium]
KKKTIRHIYTQDEINIILKKFINNDTFTCAFLVACFTGMRTGEVCALTWDNIDFEKRIISIEHNVYSKIKDEKENGFWEQQKQ